jgi:hypothetical protein
MRLQQPPPLAVAVAAMRTHRVADQTNDHVGELVVTAVSNLAQTRP